MRKYMTNLNHQENIDTNISNSKFSYFNKIENFQKKEEVVSKNSEENVNKIKEQWKNFLETKKLTPESYNQKVINKREENKDFSFLKNAKNKRELKLLFRARNAVENIFNKAKEANPKLDLNDEIFEAYTLEVFEKLKPELDKNQYTKPDDLHFGNYYSKNVYSMITKTDPWYLACHEYYRMNINDNADESKILQNDYRTLKGYKLGDIT